jgi:D-amino-acid oxidase
MTMDRRSFLAGTTLAALTACTARRRTSATAQPLPALPTYDAVPKLMPVRAHADRIFRITVCTRPFRAAGPRLDVERVGEKIVVHNYGHGGSGWSLSWGSSRIAADNAMSTGEREIAVIGCGALGLTSAILLQRAGAKVTIYAKERPPEVRSARATGSWTPDSRIALAKSIGADFPALWEKMCRYSFHMYESYLGMPGNPVEWTDRYTLWDDETPQRSQPSGARSEALEFAQFRERVADLTPRSRDLPPGAHPFPTRYARRNSSLMFNVAGYARQLVNDFLVEGGRIEPVEFRDPSELTRLPQKTIVNATGYGARALWKDESIVPVRGQIAWLIPQPEVNYGVMYRNIFVLSRRDGIVVQDAGIGDMEGYNVANEEPDRAAAEASIEVIADLFGRMRIGAGV